jgi:hypothetical protein
MFSAGISYGILLSQPVNVYPVLVGSAGAVTADSYFPVIGLIVVPLFVLNVIV